jgi:hypothetical protein
MEPIGTADELFHFTDDPVKAIEIIRTHQKKQQAVENE